jgi:WD40 repeat protein
MCAGRPPFSGETPLAVLRSVCENAPPPLRELQPETPAWLEHVILRLLEKDPARRYQSAAEVAAALEHGEVAVPTVIAQPVASVTPTPKRTRAWLTIALALAAVTLTTTAALIGASRGWSIAPSANEVSTPHAIPNPDEVAPPDRFAPPPAIESSKLYGEIGRMQFPGKINSLDLSPDGKLAYVAVDKLVHVCDLDQQREIGQFPGHTDVVAVVAVAPDGARIATGAFDRTLRIWNAADRRQLVQVDLPVGVRCAAFSPDGRQVLVSFSGASPNFPELGSLTIFDAETGNVVRKLTDDMGEAFWSVAWSPAGTHVAAGNYLDQLALFETARFDTPTRGQTRIASHRGPVYALRFSSDGARLYSGAAGGFVNCWNMADHSRLHRWEIGQPVKCIDLGSGESRLLLGGTIDVRVFDTRLAGEQAVTKLPGHTGPLTGLRFDRDDGRAVSASADGTLRLWKLPPRE